MSVVFNALPGFEVPVGAITKSMAQMWADAAASGKASPDNDDVKATQINLVLHLGFGTSASDAATQFQTAVRFSRRYPCRVVVLCPLAIEDKSTKQMRAKIYGECHLGKNKGDTRCCEFVMLSYPMSARQFLESQVSICLSTDLPLYYWVHRFHSATRLADYQYLLRESKRVILDSAIIPPSFAEYTWPNPENLRDLALARMLPIRQGVGQFLSACEPADLVNGLVAVRAASTANRAAEAAALLKWTRERMDACGAPATLRYKATPLMRAVGDPAGPATDALELAFEYEIPERRFHWKGDFAAGTSQITACLCHGPMDVSAPLTLLSPEAALAEAMFF